MNLSSSLFLVVGGTSGIGLATARAARLVGVPPGLEPCPTIVVKCAIRKLFAPMVPLDFLVRTPTQ